MTTIAVAVGWGLLMSSDASRSIWSMMGVVNQLLASAALAVATSMLLNRGKGNYACLTLVPMLFIITTSMFGGVLLIQKWIFEDNWVSISLTFFVMLGVGLFLLIALFGWVKLIFAKQKT